MGSWKGDENETLCGVRIPDSHSSSLQSPGASEDERITLLNNLGEGVGIVDLDEAFVFANPAAHRIFGVEDDCLVGRNIKEFLLPGVLAEIEEQTEHRKQGVTSSYEVEIVRPDRSTATILVTATPRRGQDGEITGTLGIFRDMTDRLRAEEDKRKFESQLLQTSKMEAVGTLSGGIAHDFNNILSAIIGYTQLAMDDAGPGSIQQSNLEEVLQASRRATDLVQQILTFARRVDHELEPISITPVVREALRLIRSSLPSSIAIEQEITGGDDCVLANPTQIHQIVMNLCTNAAQAMKMGQGTLTVELDQVNLVVPSPMMVDGGGPGSYLRLRVSDTGAGINEDVIDSIFDPYFTTREQGEGTGLGLSVVLGIVQSCKGDIGVSSTPGAGTTFTVLLPVTDRPEEEEAASGEILLTGTERVLFVDDEPMLVALGQDILGSLGYAVTGSTSSTEALELVRSDPARFDLVVTDLTMPTMNGDQLAQSILEIRSEMRVVLTTGLEGKWNMEKARALGLSGFTRKPFERENLARTIRQALDSGLC